MMTYSISETVSFSFGETQIKAIIARSPRRHKTISFRLEQVGEVKLYCPMSFTLLAVETLLRKRLKWLIENWKRIEQSPPAKRPRLFVSGETISFMGNPLQLHIIEIPHLKSSYVTHAEGTLTVRIRQYESHQPPSSENISQSTHDRAKTSRVRTAVKTWLRQRAEIQALERTKIFAAEVGVALPEISIGDAKTRWGSCSPHLKRIRYNWHVVLLPPPLLDYVVVHELCHLLVPNHSQAFWYEVEKHLPDYHERKQALKHLTAEIDF